MDELRVIAAAAALLASGLALGGCASSSTGSSLSGRTSAGTGSRIAVSRRRRCAPEARTRLTPDQRGKLQQELVAARDPQGAKAAGKDESTAPAKA